MNHRRTPAPGIRPRGRFAAGTCPVCGSSFVLDRAAQPWARSRTCSESCRARLGNRGRSPLSCEHCVMVEDYVVERERQLAALEDDPELMRDEDARSRVVVFGTWLRFYGWSSQEAVRWVA